MLLPESFQRNIGAAFGPAGSLWLNNLPDIINAYAQRWNLTIGQTFRDLSYNYVAPVRRKDGRQAVIKLGVPNPELNAEIEALRIYDGHGAVRLLAADPQGGALLLERLRPGAPLLSLENDSHATQVAAKVMLQLRNNQSQEGLENLDDLIPLERWTVGLERLQKHYHGGTGPFPRHLIDNAAHLFSEMLASTTARVMLHGDLHHWNILSAQRQPWLAIDPKGVVGDPAFEVAAWMLNSYPDLRNWSNLKQVLSRRLDLFSDILALDRKRLHSWSLAQSVLSAWWHIEDNTAGFAHSIAVAEILFRLRS
jgi:streptomycin 6-kinase